MTRRLACLATLAWLVVAPASAELRPERTLWILVQAPALREAVQPLVKHRRAEGFRVITLDVIDAGTDPQSAAAELRGRLRAAWSSWNGPSLVLLVGAPLESDTPNHDRFVVPALRGTRGRMAGEPTDNGYACLPGEVMPRVAVGRLPARNVAEARMMIDRVISWDRQRRGNWQRRLVVFAGAPSFNPLVDRMVENLAMAQFAKLDPSWTGNAIYFNPTSHFTLPIDQLDTHVAEYLDRGQALTVYMGHSNAAGFWYEGSRGPMFSASDWQSLRPGTPQGLFATFGCWGAQLDGAGGVGYAVSSLRDPRGPVAVVGSEGECWAAMATLMSEGLLKNLPDADASCRLGEVWLAMTQNLARGEMNPLIFHALNAVDGDPNTPEPLQRLEHQEMFMLLGDPATRWPRVEQLLALSCPGAARPGGKLRVSAPCPKWLWGASGMVTLEREFTSDPAGLEPLPPERLPMRNETILRNHRRANDFVLEEASVTVTDGQIEAILDVPANVPWRRLIVRVAIRTAEHEALGTRAIRVQSPAPRPAMQLGAE
jgi:hypothetical protein